MDFIGTQAAESIWFKSQQNSAMYRFTMLKSLNVLGEFTVSCGLSDTWCYCFQSNDPSDYERVKLAIISAASGCEHEDKLLTAVSRKMDKEFIAIITYSST